jgi:segregation and condensation protein B
MADISRRADSESIEVRHSGERRPGDKGPAELHRMEEALLDDALDRGAPGELRVVSLDDAPAVEDDVAVEDAPASESVVTAEPEIESDEAEDPDSEALRSEGLGEERSAEEPLDEEESIEQESADDLPATDAGVDADADVDEQAGVADASLPAASPVLGTVEGDEAPELSDPAEIAAVAFAALLTQRDGLPRTRLAEVCNASTKALEPGLEMLATRIAAAGLPLELARTGDVVRLMTAPVVFPYLRRLRQTKGAERISPAALETLAVVAYRQPVIRAEIESIRGVKVGPVLRWLLEHRLIDVVGRADVPGRPLQYGTTKLFLERFGLASLDDLPSVREFQTLQ